LLSDVAYQFLACIQLVMSGLSTTTSTPLIQKYGNEVRQSILQKTEPTGIGFTGPPYDPSDELVLPYQIGVRDEGSMDATIDAIRGAAFYADMIGFGAPSNGFTREMAVKPYPLGVNYFIKTSQKCSNGEPLYEYVEGIPKGNALGNRMRLALEGGGYPPLKGLGPAMIEDVKDALNPKPIVRTLFGSGYPRCKQVKRRVGTSLNRLYAIDENNQEDKSKPVVENPNDVIYDGETNEFGPVPKQLRWVLDKYVDRETYEADQAALAAASASQKTEAFCGCDRMQQLVLGSTAGLLLIAALLAFKARR
jgi:hypothetical protein